MRFEFAFRQRQLHGILGFEHRYHGVTLPPAVYVRHGAARGFIDTARVGIGGVSHGSFVPLYLMQGVEDSDPARAEQYEKWRAMKN